MSKKCDCFNCVRIEANSPSHQCSECSGCEICESVTQEMVKDLYDASNQIEWAIEKSSEILHPTDGKEEVLRIAEALEDIRNTHSEYTRILNRSERAADARVSDLQTYLNIIQTKFGEQLDELLKFQVWWTQEKDSMLAMLKLAASMTISAELED